MRAGTTGGYRQPPVRARHVCRRQQRSKATGTSRTRSAYGMGHAGPHHCAPQHIRCLASLDRGFSSALRLQALTPSTACLWVAARPLRHNQTTRAGRGGGAPQQQPGSMQPHAPSKRGHARGQLLPWHCTALHTIWWWRCCALRCRALHGAYRSFAHLLLTCALHNQGRCAAAPVRSAAKELTPALRATIRGAPGRPTKGPTVPAQRLVRQCTGHEA